MNMLIWVFTSIVQYLKITTTTNSNACENAGLHYHWGDLLIFLLL